MSCLRREGRAKLSLLTIIIPIAIGVIVEPCWGVCASLPIFLCLETVSCWGDLEICLLLPMDREGGRIDGGIRPEKMSSGPQGLITFSPRILRVAGTGVFFLQGIKGRDWMEPE